MLTFYHKYKGDITSQNGENLIIEEIIKRIGLKKGRCVEFGAPNKKFCSNIYPLMDRFKCDYFDINPSEAGITKAEITPENVNQIIGKCNIVSFDTDGPDYNIWQAYTFTPDIVVIEVNSSVKPPEEMVPGTRGASYMSMLMLGLSKGYFLVCHTGNMVFLLNKHRKLFPEIIGDGLSNWQDYFNISHL